MAPLTEERKAELAGFVAQCKGKPRVDIFQHGFAVALVIVDGGLPVRETLKAPFVVAQFYNQTDAKKHWHKAEELIKEAQV